MQWRKAIMAIEYGSHTSMTRTLKAAEMIKKKCIKKSNHWRWLLQIVIICDSYESTYFLGLCIDDDFDISLDILILSHFKMATNCDIRNFQQSMILKTLHKLYKKFSNIADNVAYPIINEKWNYKMELIDKIFTHLQ